MKMRRKPDTVLHSHAVYSSPARRGDGSGSIGVEVNFGTFDVSWAGEELIMIQGSWHEGYREFSQWWILRETAGDSSIQPDPVAAALIEAVGYYANSLHNEIWIFSSPGFWTKSAELYDAVQSAEWDDIILNKTIKAAIREDVEGFFRKEKLYKDLGAPWKRGVIFTGPAGNGKSSVIKAVMNDLLAKDIPVLYVRTFKQFGDDEAGLREIFAKAREMSPCFMVIEVSL